MKLGKFKVFLNIIDTPQYVTYSRLAVWEVQVLKKAEKSKLNKVFFSSYPDSYTRVLHTQYRFNIVTELGGYCRRYL